MFQRIKQGRRSSQLKRLSAVSQEPDEKSSKNGDKRPTLIPQPTSRPTRSSSVEREDGRNSRRSRIPRSTSCENLPSEECKGRMETPLVRSNENVFTPQNASKYTGQSSSRMTTVSVKKSVRRDNRPLTDRAYQHVQLARVREYLKSQNILPVEQLFEVRCPVTTKLFITIINSLVQKLLPRVVISQSNYCEQIPIIMKILKYPGNCSRSWLLTANSPHAWPHVLGLFSWFTDLLSLCSSDLQYLNDDDNDVLDRDRMINMHAYTGTMYKEWNETGDRDDREEDFKFFEDLFADKEKLFTEKLTKVRKDVETLQALVSQTKSPEELAAEEIFKKTKIDVARKSSTVKHIEDQLQNARTLSEKHKNENTCLKEKLLTKRENLKKLMSNTDSNKFCMTEDLEKIKSEVASCSKIVKRQESYLTDLDNQCYAEDLKIVRHEETLENLKIKLETLLQDCTSQYEKASQPAFSLAHKSSFETTAEVQTLLKDMKISREIVVREKTTKKEELKIEINGLEEKRRKLNEKICQKAESLLLQKEVIKQKKKIYARLEREIKERNEVHSKLTGENIVLEDKLEKEQNYLIHLEKEIKSLDLKQGEEAEKYNRLLNTLREKLKSHFKKCDELFD